MPAPRRIGKTWTINRLAGDLKKDGWVAIEVDVEGVDKQEEFSKRLCKGVEAQLSRQDRFKSHLSQRFQNLIGGDWSGSAIDALGKIDAIEFWRC
jgi:ribosomal protein S3